LYDGGSDGVGGLLFVFAAGSGNVMSQMMDHTLYNDVMALVFGKFCFGSQTQKLVAPRYVP
jgi:hypothetical protein